MLWTNILLCLIVFLLVSILGGIYKIERNMGNHKEVQELLERVKDNNDLQIIEELKKEYRKGEKDGKTTKL